MHAGSMKGRDFLRMSDVSSSELSQLLALAARLKAEPAALRGALDGRCVALLFEKPSLRTKASFTVGAARLGLQAVSFAAEEIGLGKRESLEDGARVLSRYFDALVYRTFAQDRLAALAEHATVPVINGLTDLEHPCQALADLLTIREEFGRLEGLTLAWIGDGNNVCHSLMVASALQGVAVRVATPDSLRPDESVVAEARAAGGQVTLLDSPAAAVEGAHVVVTDTWTSMGHEAEAARRRETLSGFQVDSALMARARPEAIFLHCLPAHRGEEVTHEVMESGASRIFPEAENRMHAQMALLAHLLGAA